MVKFTIETGIGIGIGIGFVLELELWNYCGVASWVVECLSNEMTARFTRWVQEVSSSIPESRHS
jgi:hypothetical protein